MLCRQGRNPRPLSLPRGPYGTAPQPYCGNRSNLARRGLEHVVELREYRSALTLGRAAREPRKHPRKLDKQVLVQARETVDVDRLRTAQPTPSVDPAADRIGTHDGVKHISI
jgi:hypothetical protein